MTKLKKAVLIIIIFLAAVAIAAGSVFIVMRRKVSDGKDGIGIKNIKPNGTDENGANVYKITLTDGTVYTFTAPQGLPGTDGQDGTPGADGKDGAQGADGKDGETPYIGENGNWYIGNVDTGVKAAGTDGADGQNGKDAVLPNMGCVASGSGVFGYDQNENICCIGYAQYIRTGQSSGYLNLSVSLIDTTDESWYKYIDLRLISTVLGIKLKKPSGISPGSATGYWAPVSTKTDLTTAAEYGATCVYDGPEYICLARIYKTDTFASGAWGLNFLDVLDDDRSTYTLTGIEVEEY